MPEIFSIASKYRAGYDVPLHLKLGTEFLVMLVSLMAFLSILSVCVIIGIGHLSKAWTSGLENSITIEIPATTTGPAQIDDLMKSLRKIKGVDSVKRVGEKDMQEMLSPWLGNIPGLWDDLPIPALVTVTLSERTKDTTNKISLEARKIAPDATVDAHEEWLSALLRIANGVRLVSFGVFFLILAVTATVVGGAVRARMAIHQRELELLHIMGASDSYITGQFCRYILTRAVKGVAIGLALSLAALGALAFFARNDEAGIIPTLTLSFPEWGIIICLPVLLVIIALIAASITSLRVLREMP